jgi:hypothetical protein
MPNIITNMKVRLGDRVKNDHHWKRYIGKIFIVRDVGTSTITLSLQNDFSNEASIQKSEFWDYFYSLNGGQMEFDFESNA